MRSFLLSLALLGATAAAQSAPAWLKSEDGETTFTQMAAAPYPDESRAEGFKGRTKSFPRDPHYVDSTVALFIPKGFKSGERTDLLVYFHGHNNSVANSLDEFSLRQQIAASGRNLILIFPEGPKNAADSGSGRIEKPNGIKNLVNEALASLKSEKKVPQTTTLGSVTLAGHSGAYKAISFAIETGGLGAYIGEVILLDATYGRLEAYNTWMAANTNARLVSIYTEHLAAENEELMAGLEKAALPFLAKPDVELSDEEFRANRRVFVSTNLLDHNGTVGMLGRFLKTGP